jgi:F420-dependent oxidoreductase-like protein
MELRLFIEPQQGASYADQLAIARKAEECGFAAFFRSDHLLVMGDGDGLPGPTDTWTTLAGLARDTNTIRLGTLVTSATFRHPGLLAVQVAQVDEMSGGRVELGLGAGWSQREHAAYGIPFSESVGERFDRLEEQLAIITGLWATPVGERFTHEGRHYTLVDSPALPKPVQTPVPIVIGGTGRRRTPELAGRYASDFNLPFVSVQESPGCLRTSGWWRARPGATCPPSPSATPWQSAPGGMRPRRVGAPQPSAATWTSCATTASPDRRTKSSTRSASMRVWVPAGSIFRCSTCMTSTISSSSRHRS